MSDAPLPSSCDVIVVGAGPAGSACAQMLARGGLHRVLVDQHDFPRDKVCGDGLIPDAHAALRRLGVHDEVMAQAQAARTSLHRPARRPRRRARNGGSAAAQAARPHPGACGAACRRALHTPWRFEAPLVEADASSARA
jgi:2-polyprenyl-6-methoxyphenol hydroxylase-like FAD-dependent oxidoreductase